MLKLLLVALISLLASTAGAVCGIGGGVVIKPVLDALGVASVAAVSFLSGCTVLSMSAYSVTTSFAGGGSRIRLRVTLPLSVGAAAGGLLGKALFGRIAAAFPNPDTVGAVQAACLFLLTAGTLIYTLKKDRVATKKLQNPAGCAGVGLALGVCSAFLGIGGGPFNLVVLSFCFSMETKEAAQNSLFIILCSQLASLLSTILARTVPAFDPLMLLLMAAMGILGSILGRKVYRRLDSRKIDRLFLGMIVVILCICVYNFLRFLR